MKPSQDSCAHGCRPPLPFQTWTQPDLPSRLWDSSTLKPELQFLWLSTTLTPLLGNQAGSGFQKAVGLRLRNLQACATFRLFQKRDFLTASGRLLPSLAKGSRRQAEGISSRYISRQWGRGGKGTPVSCVGLISPPSHVFWRCGNHSSLEPGKCSRSLYLPRRGILIPTWVHHNTHVRYSTVYLGNHNTLWIWWHAVRMLMSELTGSTYH